MYNFPQRNLNTIQRQVLKANSWCGCCRWLFLFCRMCQMVDTNGHLPGHRAVSVHRKRVENSNRDLFENHSSAFDLHDLHNKTTFWSSNISKPTLKHHKLDMILSYRPSFEIWPLELFMAWWVMTRAGTGSRNSSRKKMRINNFCSFCFRLIRLLFFDLSPIFSGHLASIMAIWANSVCFSSLLWPVQMDKHKMHKIIIDRPQNQLLFFFCCWWEN